MNKLWGRLNAQIEEGNLEGASDKLRSINDQLSSMNKDFNDKYDSIIRLQDQVSEVVSLFRETEYADELNQNVIMPLEIVLDNLSSIINQLMPDGENTITNSLTKFVENYREGMNSYDNIEDIADEDFVSETGGDARSIEDKLNGHGSRYE